MTRRYHAAQLPCAGGYVSLDEAERHHALNVMRVRAGERIVLFDGQGNEAAAVVHTVSKREVVCESEAASQANRENKVRLTLGVAMPKGDRAKELVERLTELGVNRLVPLHCQRSQWTVPENVILKWQRVMIDACKQCGRNQFMEITPPQSLVAWLSSDAATSPQTRYLVHPESSIAQTPTPLGNQERPSASAEEIAQPLAVPAQATIGPEGGFNDAEVELADLQGWKRLMLGSRVYRIETAAVLVAIKLAQL